ncbi:hypothetical protein EUGRSUZ_C00514 [Eucalyptus grandis]|uniref:Uncharacterized protein n=2 Tax=Eucalyptus grandis TaxID=71139 RepID=A0ACC3LC01_EUCGR|nr:hypothetical protein EUGRSUZ_C00514 [Eucalyptus grandis]
MGVFLSLRKMVPQWTVVGLSLGCIMKKQLCLRHVIDAQKFEGEPVAKTTLPQRVPCRFLGTFVLRTN